jgi:hypothetical protein
MVMTFVAMLRRRTASRKIEPGRPISMTELMQAGSAAAMMKAGLTGSGGF